MGDDIVQDAQTERLVVTMMIKEDLNAVQLAALVADRGGVTAQPISSDSSRYTILFFTSTTSNSFLITTYEPSSDSNEACHIHSTSCAFCVVVVSTSIP